MCIFLDTAGADETRKAAALGAVSGVITRPSLASKEGVGSLTSHSDAILETTDMVDGPI